MSEIIQCSSCGGSNQLQEGKTSMFCAFCGNGIAKKQIDKELNNENLIKAKPKIIDFTLSLKERNISSLKEVLVWFSDDELENIAHLDLSNNNIFSLDGLNSFSRIEEIDLSYNKFTEISANDIDKINSINIQNNQNGFKLNLLGNPITSEAWVSKIKISSILNSYTGEMYLDSNYDIKYHTHYNLVKLTILTNDAEIDEYHPKSTFHPNNKNTYDGKNGYCFIASATMGNYEHPEVMELRNLRDNWILEKRWGESFVQWYYHYGANAAKFIEKSFVLKKISYILIVKPLVYFSRIVKIK
jgi:hypothetical protein